MPAHNEMVLLYHSERMKYLVCVPKTGRFSTHRGYLEFADVQARDWGDKVSTQYGCDFWLLKPTLADLALKVRRTTTIVYPKDTGYVLLETMVFPGARVVECGSGSGAMTTILASFVRPDGRVYSYERRPEFSENARQNVTRQGLERYCEFFVRDPESEGFDQEDVDAVFLDVPEPWTLVRSARRALRGGNPLAAIIPTAEQLARTVAALEVEGFARIRVNELLKREILVRSSGVRPADRMIGHTVYIVLAHKTNAPAGTGAEPTEERADGPVEPSETA